MVALYQKVFDDLRAAIERGDYPVGQRLPSDAELTEKHGVSVITVKKALDLLRNDGYISRRPRVGTTVISDVATAAPASHSLTHPLVGLIVTNFDDTFGTRILGGLLDRANASANLLVKRSLGDASAEDRLIRALVDGGVRALILQPSSSVYIPPAVLELVTKDFPVVILDRGFDGVPVSTVCSDNIAAGQQATEYLFSLGHEHVGLVSSDSTVSTLRERRDGYVKAHAMHHIPHDDALVFDLVHSTTPGSTISPAEDVNHLEAYLRDHPEVTAVVATEYYIAAMLRVAADRMQRRIPDDLSIVCFDHPDAFYDPGRYRFTHIRQDQEGMGDAAVDLTLALIRDPREVRKVTLSTELVIGESTAPLP
ncbi:MULTISPECIES: GntR family transcriptional regulator [Microbacterium]|uniref:GntR family transcriptional regulator n=1 Tax=Microbacterium wangchenii TaxID=2541726 RepID=A0ABX5SW82_9MICO|nr:MULTISPECIES: GntR family transcriptional regulator [Microbacterium]MCK6066188.1 GntR family transcriptional regulator [Microbacterium sp. EYE_512]QBR90461.1 GntR family transcriptional regulator [Microbacterium wangchenii]TXK14487.1 GntR family transcriptional regulator [Microbacterium wangchenii]